MNKKLIVIILILNSVFAWSQSIQLSLQDVIRIAKENSPDAQKAKHLFRANYWQYRTYKRSMLPQLSFDGTIPSINRAFTPYTTSEGVEKYVGQSYISYTSALRLNQRIGLTGGNVFLSTGLQRVDNYHDSTTTKNYLSTPISIGYNQPLFNYNPYKWNKKIEPIKYEKSKRQYLEAVEQVSIRAINYFFDLLAVEMNMNISTINVANYDTLYKIAQGRYSLGKIKENDLLQLELQLLKSKSQKEKVKLDYQNTLYRFKSFLRLKDNKEVILILPEITEYNTVSYNEALNLASENNPKVLEFEQRLLEAKANLSRAKTENGLNANLYAVFGLMQNADLLPVAYQNPNNQQQVTLGISVPILDWGMRKGQIKMAESNMDLIEESIEQEKIDFNQSIFMQVAQYNMQENQLIIAAKRDTIARKSFNVIKNRYYTGGVSVTDLNIAQNDMDNSKINYIRSLQNYWRTLYLLRKSTLYDFKQNKPLEADFEEIYK